jgi:hypothetical protein
MSDYLTDTAELYTRALFGQHARRAGAWLYVQDAGDGMVSFVGASRVPAGPHPFRYGSSRAHQLLVGEVMLRPELVVATDARQGTGVAGLLIDPWGLDTGLMRDRQGDPAGEVVLGDPARVRQVLGETFPVRP